MTTCAMLQHGACPASRRSASPRARALVVRAAAVVVAVVALFAMAYGESWTLDRAGIAGRELVAVTSAIDAVSARSNGLTSLRPAPVTTINGAADE